MKHEQIRQCTNPNHHWTERMSQVQQQQHAAAAAAAQQLGYYSPNPYMTNPQVTGQRPPSVYHRMPPNSGVATTSVGSLHVQSQSPSVSQPSSVHQSQISSNTGMVGAPIKRSTPVKRPHESPSPPTRGPPTHPQTSTYPGLMHSNYKNAVSYTPQIPSMPFASRVKCSFLIYIPSCRNHVSRSRSSWLSAVLPNRSATNGVRFKGQPFPHLADRSGRSCRRIAAWNERIWIEILSTTSWNEPTHTEWVGNAHSTQPIEAGWNYRRISCAALHPIRKPAAFTTTGQFCWWWQSGRQGRPASAIQ